MTTDDIRIDLAIWRGSSQRPRPRGRARGTVTLSATIVGGGTTPSYGYESGQIVIDGGTFEMLAGSSVNVSIEFTSAGGEADLLDATSALNVSGSNGTINLTNAQVAATGGGYSINFQGNVSNDIAYLAYTRPSAVFMSGSAKTAQVAKPAWLTPRTLIMTTLDSWQIRPWISRARTTV
jgi:hypothetical protein